MLSAPPQPVAPARRNEHHRDAVALAASRDVLALDDARKLHRLARLEAAQVHDLAVSHCRHYRHSSPLGAATLHAQGLSGCDMDMDRAAATAGRSPQLRSYRIAHRV